MAAVTTFTRFQQVSFVAVAYASSSSPTLVCPEGQDLNVCYAQLTGNMTMTPTVTKLLQGQKVFFHFNADTSNRIVTFSTGFDLIQSWGITGATLTVPIGADAMVSTWFDGTALRIFSVTCEGRGETTESPAYAASVEVTDQAAKRHIVSPAQLTGALTLNATNVTKHIVGDEFVFHFSTDGTQRIVTFGTNILSSGTVTIPANKTATARGFFNGTSICITGREISA